MNKNALRILIPLLLIADLLRPFVAFSMPTEAYEQRQVGKITVVFENLPRGATFSQDRVLSKLALVKFEISI